MAKAAADAAAKKKREDKMNIDGNRRKTARKKRINCQRGIKNIEKILGKMTILEQEQFSPDRVAPPSPQFVQPPRPSQSYFQPSQPFVQTAQSYFQPSQPFVQTAQPLFQPSQPFVQTAQPLFQPSQPFVQTAQPLFQPSPVQQSSFSPPSAVNALSKSFASMSTNGGNKTKRRKKRRRRTSKMR
jgi:hypothetical protein